MQSSWEILAEVVVNIVINTLRGQQREKEWLGIDLSEKSTIKK